MSRATLEDRRQRLADLEAQVHIYGIRIPTLQHSDLQIDGRQPQRTFSRWLTVDEQRLATSLICCAMTLCATPGGRGGIYQLVPATAAKAASGGGGFGCKGGSGRRAGRAAGHSRYTSEGEQRKSPDLS